MHNEFKGTPGKLAAYYGDAGTLIVNDHDECIARLGGFSTIKCEDEANARLFAAAPELLAALQLCEEFMSNLESTGFDGLARIEAAREAIAKALGEQS